jgi:putative heme-binding domain-containing protein
MNRPILVIYVVASFSGAAFAGEPDVIPHRQDRPPNQPHYPAAALRRMTVPDGFSVELVASEPEIVNPIAMTFDDRGRIWVTESVEYPRKSAGPGRDRVKILEGCDANGSATKVTVFAEGLNIPTGVAVGYGGVWVMNAPDLLFLREKDGKEISREVVVTGFGRTDTHELPNSLTWGPDGWLYGLNGVFNHCQVQSNGKTFDFTCALWRIHPRSREFQVVCQGTSNPWGLAWDAEGSAFVSACHWATDHVFHFVETGYYTRQAGAYPPFTLKIGSITNHSHQKTAYCGLCYFDSDAYPERYRRRLYMGNIHGGCINVDVLRRDGSTYISDGEPDFLTANDAWFMPVSQKVGPDGCLYVLDWYDRYHCSQDAARDPAGVDRTRGRLYRVRYRNTPRAPSYDLAAESDERLVERLSSPNIYFRESAQRLLTERNTKAVRNRLQSLVLDNNASRTSRLHGLWAIIGGGTVDPEFHLRVLAHSDPTFRAWGVRAAGNSHSVSPAVLVSVSALASDPSPDVQLQVAIAARKIDGLDALPFFMDVLSHCGQDRLIPLIVWPNLHPLLEEQSERFTRLATGINRSSAPSLLKLLPRAIERILASRQANTDVVAPLLNLLMDGDPEFAREALHVVATKTRSLSAADQVDLRRRLQPLLAKLLAGQPDRPLYLSGQLLAAQLNVGGVDAAAVRRLFTDPKQPDAVRLQALETLVAFRDPEYVEAVAQVLSNGSPAFLARVFDGLGHSDNPKLADVVLRHYPKLAPEVQPLAIELLMQRLPWTRKLLDAVLENRLPRGVLNANHLRRILDANDREAVWAVEKAFGTVRKERNPERDKVVAEMGQYLRQHPGDPKAGATAFKKLCAQCHTIYGEGAAVGPDLTNSGRASFDQLLSNVFDPSLVIGPGYQATTVVTKDGRSLTGLIAEDNAQQVVLKLPGGGQKTIARGDVESVTVSNLSMMPEGIENVFDRSELADLFAFLSLDRPPGDPKARPIPGTPGRDREARLSIENADRRLIVRLRLPGADAPMELLTYVIDPMGRPYLHPVRDPACQNVLTEDRPADHPWQHGIFTGFHRVNGLNYWKEDEGRQRFVRLLDLREDNDVVAWRSLTELIATDGRVVAEEEQAITVHAPTTPDRYVIDFDLLLRAKGEEVKFGKYFVGGLAVRMPWDKERPRQTHLNSNGQIGRAGEQQRATWCTVERPFGETIFGFAVFDHPSNANHPSGWRVDEQGLINPNVSSTADWAIPAGKERTFRYRILVYRGPGQADILNREFQGFSTSADSTSGTGPARK